MMSHRTGLQKLTGGPTRRQAIAGIAMAFGGLSLGSMEAWAQANGAISHRSPGLLASTTPAEAYRNLAHSDIQPE
jgi:hypothetical protein